jgi:hydrogenase nickel incorporation protein HypA/HybF
MHELAIANSVFDAVQKETQLRSARRVTRIGLRLGDLAGVNAEALTFCFEAVIKHTPLESVLLEIERCPQRHRCSECGNTFAVVNYDSVCPACGETKTIFVSGDELELAYLEMEDA